MTKKSKRQVQILETIYSAIEENGYPPTVREIGALVGLSSTSTVHGHLSRLEEAGHINRNPDSPRAIEITTSGLELIDKVPSAHSIPVLGTVTAGAPITAFEDPMDTFPIPSDFENDSTDLYMLIITGESMIEAGILDGDQVIVRKQSAAKNGEIVIAMTSEDEATCKRFYKEDGYYRLHPENSTMDDIILDEVTILGKVVGLYRPEIY